MDSGKKRKDLPKFVDCPHCGHQETTEVVVNKGFMRGRPSCKGGPYYQFKCAFCHKEYECFFEEEVFTRKPSLKKEFISRLSRWLRLPGGEEEKEAASNPSSSGKRNAPRVSLRPVDSGTTESEDEGLPLIFRIHPELLRCFRLLGLDYRASAKMTKQRYKKLVRKYHPDRSSHLGEDERREATKKLIEINKAYGTIKEYFM